MKIVISNTVMLNTGDAAILEGTVRILKAAFGDDIQIQVHDMTPAVSAGLYPEYDIRAPVEGFPGRTLISAVRKLRQFAKIVAATDRARIWVGAHLVRADASWIARVVLRPTEAAAIEAYRDADLVVSTGGTYLVETYPLESRIFGYQIARLFSRPLVLFTQSLGPFTKPAYRRALCEVFRNAALILLRDERSRRHLEDLDLRLETCHVVADAAFALADETAPPESSHGSVPRIAISVRDWPHFINVDHGTGMRSYEQAVAELIGYLVDRYNAHITFISTCQGTSSYWFDDSAVAARIADALLDAHRANVTVDREFRSPQAFRHAMTEFDLVIATRMHAAIMALTVGVPVIAIAYEFKTTELFERLGMADWVTNIQNVRAADLIHVAELVLTDLVTIRSELRPRVDAEVRSAFDAVPLLRRAVGSLAGSGVDPAAELHT